MEIVYSMSRLIRNLRYLHKHVYDTSIATTLCSSTGNLFVFQFTTEARSPLDPAQAYTLQAAIDSTILATLCNSVRGGSTSGCKVDLAVAVLRFSVACEASAHWHQKCIEQRYIKTGGSVLLQAIFLYMLKPS